MKVGQQSATTVAPTAGAHLTLAPIGAGGVRLDGGLLGDRQRVNREVTLVHGALELEEAGTLENFRIAAGTSTGTRRGMVFSDSDVYKFLEALAWELGREQSRELSELAKEVIALVAAAQEPDGYLNTWCQINDAAWRWTDLEMGHELYCCGHLIQAAVAFSRTTGDETLLGVARRFADLVDDVFRLGSQTGTDGHPEIETALVELYRETGEARYLELARTLTERRGHGQFAEGRFPPEYYQDGAPVRETTKMSGHAVRALYLASGVTDLYIETGDEGLLAAMLAQWEDLASGKSYLTGGIGSRHTGEAIGDAFELPPDRAYCETCAAVASIMWNWRLLMATGECRFADLLERTLYNGFLSGISLDGRRFFYVNPLQSRGGHVPRRRWDPVACCPPNIMRLTASLNEYVATSDATGVQIHQYTASTIEAVGGNGDPVSLRVATEYPWSGRVEVEIVRSSGEEWTLALRVPAWASPATLDGASVQAGDYARVTRRWRAGERVTLMLDVSPRLTVPNPRIDAVRGCLAIERGPLVYCVEGVDLPEAVDIADVRLDSAAGVADVGDAVEGLAGIPGVAASATVDGLDGWGNLEYRGLSDLGAPPPSPGPFALVAIPYFAWANRRSGPMRVWIPNGR